MTHTSLEKRAVNAVTKAIDETYTKDGLDALENVLNNMKDDLGFVVDNAVEEALRKVENKRSQSRG